MKGLCERGSNGARQGHALVTAKATPETRAVKARSLNHLKGILRLHLLLGCAVVFALWLTVWLRSRLRAQAETGNTTAILATELVVCLMVSLTAHLGGFLSGVNGGP